MKKTFVFLFFFLLVSPLYSWGQEEEDDFSVARFQMSLFPGVSKGFFVKDFNSLPGNKIEFKKDLGVNGTHTMPDLEFGLKIAPLAELYVGGTYGILAGRKNLSSPLFHEGVTYPAGKTLNSYQQVFTGEVGLLMDAVKGPCGNLQFGLGVRYAFFRSRMTALSSPVSKSTQEALFPTVRTRAELCIIGFTSLYADVTLGGIDYKRQNATFTKEKITKFWYLKFHGGLKFALVPGMNLYLGYFHNQLQLYRKNDNLIRRVKVLFNGVDISFEMKI